MGVVVATEEDEEVVALSIVRVEQVDEIGREEVRGGELSVVFQLLYTRFADKGQESVRCKRGNLKGYREHSGLFLRWRRGTGRIFGCIDGRRVLLERNCGMNDKILCEHQRKERFCNGETYDDEHEKHREGIEPDGEGFCERVIVTIAERPTEATDPVWTCVKNGGVTVTGARE